MYICDIESISMIGTLFQFFQGSHLAAAEDMSFCWEAPWQSLRPCNNAAPCG